MFSCFGCFLFHLIVREVAVEQADSYAAVCMASCLAGRVRRQLKFDILLLLVAGMFRAIAYFLFSVCAGTQPVLNVIAEPPLVAHGSGLAQGFREVSLVAAKLSRHALEQQQTLADSVDAMFAVEAPAVTRAKPLALLDSGSASGSAAAPELHIHPPVQDDRDVLVELDGVMQAEQAKRRLADELFAGDKQRMLDVEKAELRRIIREVLA